MHDDPDIDVSAGAGTHEHGHVHEEDIEGLEKFTLRSVGIDIGSSTSHLVFSRLTLRREGASLSARFVVTERTVLHRSPILLTPYIAGTLIDTDRVIDFVHRSYREAGFTPDDWSRKAQYPYGEREVIDIFRNMVHEGVHHLRDVENVLRAVGLPRHSVTHPP